MLRIRDSKWSEIYKKSGSVLRQRSSVKYAWIQQNHSYWPISAMYQVLDVSESGYYHDWTRGTAQHHFSVDALLTHIRAIHREVKGEYGWPRVRKALQAKGVKVSNDRVRKLMNAYGIQA